MMKKIFTIAALALLMTACSNDIDEPQAQQSANPNGMITITAKLAPKSEAGTRAVETGKDFNNNDIIKVKWAQNEQLAILYEVNSEKKLAVATINHVDENTGIATVTFAVESGTADDTPCTIVYPYDAAKDDYSGVKDAATLLAEQNGTLNANLDVRVGAGTIITSTPNLAVTTQPEAQFAIVKFTLTDGTDAINAKEFTIRDGSDNFVSFVLLTSHTSTFYVAMAPATSSTFKFEVMADDESTFFYTKTNVTLTAGKFYQSQIQMGRVIG